MFNDKKVCVVIPAAGSGSRMGSHQPKQFLEINGKPIVVYTIQVFNSLPEVDSIVLVVRYDSIDFFKRMTMSLDISKTCHVIAGGNERQDSVWNGLQVLKNQNIDIVVVHDAVRPFVTHEIVRAVISTAADEGASIAAVRSKDTVKISNGTRLVQSTPEREHVWITQTPQAFQFSLLYQSYERACAEKFYGTDDASLVEHAGFRVKIVESFYDNIKITTPEDLELASLIAHRRK